MVSSEQVSSVDIPFPWRVETKREGGMARDTAFEPEHGNMNMVKTTFMHGNAFGGFEKEQKNK